MSEDTTGHVEPGIAAEPAEEGAAPESLAYSELEKALLADDPEATAEPQAEAVVPDPEAKPEMVSREEYDKLEKQLKDKELFIQRQGTEIGQARKLKESLLKIAQEKRAKAEEQLTTDPVAALDSHAEAREAEREANEAGVAEAIEANKFALQEHLPGYEDRIESIAAAALEMGVPPEYVENYKRNPYATPIGVLLPYARAAALREQTLAKTALVDKLQAQLKEFTSGNFSRKISEVAKKAPVVTGKGSAQSVSGTDDVDESMIHNLSDAEIERLLKVK
jgi:hypothetical protein